MNQKINKITEEINKVEAQITRLQERLPTLKKKRAGLENTEIIRLVRSSNVPPDELAAFIATIKGNQGNNDLMEDTTPADESEREEEGLENED